VIAVEQDNSLNMSLQQLVAAQNAQLNELKQMRVDQQQSRNEGGVISGQSNVRISPYAPYSSPYPSPYQYGGSQPSFSTPKFIQSYNDFIGSVFPNPMRVNSQNRELIQMQTAGRVANATMQGIGTAADVGSGLLASAVVPGLIGSTLAGTGVGLVAAAFTDNAIKQAKQYQNYNQYLLQTSYKYIDPTESSNAKYRMGFDDKQRQDVAKYLRTVNTEKFVSDEDINTMLKGFTDYNLMKGVSDVKTFKDKFSKLVDSVKSSALLLNESFEEVTKLMGDMQKMGIDSKNFSYYSALSKTAGSFVGLTGGEVMNVSGGMVQNKIQNTYMTAPQQMQNKL
jgi:hypothetical protein